MAFRPRSVAVKAKRAATTAPSAALTATAPSTSASASAPIPAAGISIAASKRAVSPDSSTFGDVARASDPEPLASTSRALAAVKLDHKEEQRLETLLSVIESCFCDWGLSAHRSSGLLDLLEASKDGCEFAFLSRSYSRKEADLWFSTDVHLQHVLKLQPVRALTDNQADVQKALRLRSSPSLTVSRVQLLCHKLS